MKTLLALLLLIPSLSWGLSHDYDFCKTIELEISNAERVHQVLNRERFKEFGHGPVIKLSEIENIDHTKDEIFRDDKYTVKMEQLLIMIERRLNIYESICKNESWRKK